LLAGTRHLMSTLPILVPAPPPAQAAAARELTALLEAHPAFSYVRLGDGEVQWMQLAAAGRTSHRYQYDDASKHSIEHVRGVTGMEARHLPRFERALHEASYVDFCDSIPAVRAYLAQAPIARRADGWRNPAAEASNLVFAWTAQELGSYLARHRCLIAGAEAALLGALWQDTAYRHAAAAVLPHGISAEFHQIRENGRRYSENLDLIKQDLVAALAATGADTLLLSLGTGAKILCPELAAECGIRAIDFGSMQRGLAYAGSSGYQAHRDMHHPFFFHVPFATHVRALEQAFPRLSPPELAGKAYAQLALELHPHQPYRFNTSDGVAGGQLDLSPENLGRFRAAWSEYRRTWWPRWRSDPTVQALDREFRRWLDKHGIGWHGRVFQGLAAGKRMLRRLGLVR
jgi:hypothetical protein